MQYQILVRNQSSDLFTAAVLGLVDCVAEGRTKEEAVANAKRALIERLAHGEIVTIEVESADTESGAPRETTDEMWRREAGRFSDDPTFNDFLAEMQSERRELDSNKSAS